MTSLSVELTELCLERLVIGGEAFLEIDQVYAQDTISTRKTSLVGFSVEKLGLGTTSTMSFWILGKKQSMSSKLLLIELVGLELPASRISTTS